MKSKVLFTLFAVLAIQLVASEDLTSEEVEEIYDEDLIIDPCEDKLCGPGKECVTDEKGTPECVCVKECLEFEDNRRIVCSNFNDTWPSDCQLHKMRCLCENGDANCLNEKYKHIHIDYYGVCQGPQTCEKEQLADFPRRMREWLFNIMRDMADQTWASETFKKLEEEAEEDESKRYINSAVWEWCILNGHPSDKFVSRHELFPLRAPLYAMEHCISPFLNSCDPNNDHKITLKEWVACLELNQDEVEKMEGLCDEIRPKIL